MYSDFTRGVLALAQHIKELHMHTEYVIKVEFHTPNHQAIATFIRACRQAAQELFTQGALISGETPSVSITVENSEIGVKKLKVFNGEEK